jgi:hypothetical protein
VCFFDENKANGDIKKDGRGLLKVEQHFKQRPVLPPKKPELLAEESEHPFLLACEKNDIKFVYQLLHFYYLYIIFGEEEKNIKEMGIGRGEEMGGVLAYKKLAPPADIELRKNDLKFLSIFTPILSSFFWSEGEGNVWLEYMHGAKIRDSLPTVCIIFFGEDSLNFCFYAIL